MVSIPFSVLNSQISRPVHKSVLVGVKNSNDLDLWKIDGEGKNIQEIISQLYYLPNKDNTPITMLAPANDGICGAIALSNTDCYPRVGANWTFFNNSTATWEASPGIPGCWGFFYGATLWYKFTATSTSQLITTDWYTGAGGNIDSQIAVYSSSNGLCTGVMTRIGCDEDITVSPGDAYGNNIPYNPDYFSETTLLGLTIGTTYFIRVDGQYDACYPFSCWTPGTGLICTQPGLSNDRCETAQSVSVNIVYSTTNNAASPISQNAVPDKAFTCGSTENMIYFSFTAPATDIFYINQWAQTCTYNRGTQFIIYKSAYTCAGIPDAWVSTGSATYELYCSAQSLADRNFSMNFVAGQTYIIAIDGGAGDECTFSWEITQSVPLAVELISFNCLVDETSIKLKWITISEQNSNYFTIERSADGNKFYEISRIKAAGQSSSTRVYEYIDTEPMGKDNYYRLSETDFNGATKKFDAIKCNVNTQDDEVYLELINMAGQIVAKKTTNFSVRNDILKDSDIPIGIYVLKINKKGISIIEKCIKSNSSN